MRQYAVRRGILYTRAMRYNTAVFWRYKYYQNNLLDKNVYRLEKRNLCIPWKYISKYEAPVKLTLDENNPVEKFNVAKYIF